MARKPARRTQHRSPQNNGSPQDPASDAPGSSREKIIAALMALLGEMRFEEIGLADIAQRGGVTLADLRAEFGSKLGIVAAFIKDIDRKVLSGGEAANEEETPRERLFEVLMRRLEALVPHRAAIRSLARAARHNLGLALALNRLSVMSAQWMLAAANIPAAGPKGTVRAQGLALLYARVLRRFLDDEDPGLARTMAALDRELARGQRWSGFLDDLCMLRLPRLCVPRRRRRTEDFDRDAEEPMPI
jgi:AcrR family transcriptional regulator